MKTYELTDSAFVSPQVKRLFGLCGQESFFNLFDWYVLIATCGAAIESRFILSVSEDESLAMALHLCQHNVLRSCTNIYTTQFDLLGESIIPANVYKFAKELGSWAGALDSIQLEGLARSSANFSPLLKGLRAAGLPAKPYFGWANWYEATNDLSFDDYLSTRPSVLKNTWNRKHALLKKRGDGTFRHYQTGDDPGPLIAVYEGIREKSWKSAEPYPRFIPGLIRLAAKFGALRFGSLLIAGEPAAAQFWIVWRGKATIFKLVHAERFASLSPGTILTMEMMRKTLEEDRPSEIDFGRGDDAYKKLWLSLRRELWGIEAGNPRTIRGLAHSGRIAAALLRNQVMRIIG